MDTVLYEGDHVRTSEGSSAIIAFGDLSTFQLGPETELVITTPPTQDSKIGLLAGNIWVNFKGMLHNHTMEVDMQLGAGGIKGTVFEASSNATSCTIKGIVDDVNFTSSTTGESVLVGPGQMVTATAYGLGTITNFNVAAEEAKWGISADFLSGSTPRSNVKLVLR